MEHQKIHGSLILLLVMYILGIGICDGPSVPEPFSPIDALPVPERGFYMGLLPTPAQDQSFDQAYSQAALYSEFVPVWGRPTPFYDLAKDLKGDWGQMFVKQLIRDKNMFPIIHLSFIGPGLTLVRPPGMESATLNDPVWRASYKQAAIDIVKASRPLYLSLGNEVNKWYERYGTDENNPNGFQHYVTLYEEVYAEVKRLSPKIIVFCTFAREIVAENREAKLDVLTMFNPDKLDILVFTSYPYVVRGINNPSNIPDDYYSKIFQYVPTKVLAFSEIGWPSLDAFGGEQAQADFLEHAIGRLTRHRGIELLLFGWPWLHDLNQNDAIGLIKIDGTEKIGYKKWIEISRR
ncbi:MAG: hypothetical protein ONB31_12130 [candidate division KSB1 bacterium]|nr:hypothetical protein [candidate division KSB1 bacterium]MDZ7336611.1 hypothetical protein [candidate division KSB1 bacterium]MDZ7358842.1 hypothetical protein [candidate division KSB1 bacterium]